jgi:GTP-binding protein
MAVLAVVGRTNVGKSTLFNRMVRSRQALVSEQPHCTRDRLVGSGRGAFAGHVFIDTAGVAVDTPTPFDGALRHQAETAIRESDGVLWLVSAVEGVLTEDLELADWLRSFGKPVLLVANKAEGRAWAERDFDLTRLGWGLPAWISALYGDGLAGLAAQLQERFAVTEAPGEAQPLPRIALIGRPNAGKSTLLNQLAGEARVLTSETPGTTRDAIEVSIERMGRIWILVDTAGVRSRTRRLDAHDQLAIARSLATISRVSLVTLLIDAQAGPTDDDARLAAAVHEAGRPLVVALNKWDGLERHQKSRARGHLAHLLSFLPPAEPIPVSALHGSGLGDLVAAWNDRLERAQADLATPQVNRALAAAVRAHPPALVERIRPKLRYGHQGGRNPPLLIIHGSRLELLSADYRRYLTRQLSDRFGLGGVPLRLEFRDSPDHHRWRRGTPAPSRGRMS